MVASIAQQAQDPDFLARQVGIERYESSVGNLRRHELYRLGNAWGMNFPSGATKDHMLPYFKQLENEGKDPFKPPRSVPLRPEFSEESHIEALTHGDDGKPLSAAPVEEAPVDDLRARVEALDHGKLKKLVKELGLPQSNTDKRDDLIERVLVHKGG